jgi:ABC-type multidrug transport system ATPase subunit
MKLEQIKIEKHPILGDLSLSFINPKTQEPYQIIVFVGENGCGKTTLLNELFNYNKSQYIVEKQGRYELIGDLGFHPLFLRQNSLYTISQNELVAKISGGSSPFPIDSNSDLVGGKMPYGMRRNGNINTLNRGKDILSLFNDPVIINAYLDKKIDGLKCGGEALKLIDGSKNEVDLTQLSSGQQEILLKLSVLQKIVAGTDYVLFDEPETSLHPRWQKNIIRFFKEMMEGQDGETPQMFIATHSEKILESLLGMEDVLIIRFSKDKGMIKAEPINQNLLTLPKTTFAELDYVVFNIPTYDYHDQLYSYYGLLIETDSTLKIDKIIRDNPLNKPEYFKKWVDVKRFKQKDGTFKEETFTYKTLPSYIRNYFHHPKDGKEPTEDELNLSIGFMQKLIIDAKQ